MIEKLRLFFRFIFSSAERPLIKDTAELLLHGMTVTSKCRYNASIRIRRLSQFSFATTTILSLGLILIPLLQNADIRLSYPLHVLNMLQIFLAVAVLVYSVINATARYETRAERLNECGDRIKELIRELRVDINNARTNKKKVNLALYNRRYTDVSADSENHTRADYTFAAIRSPEYYPVSGLPKLWMLFKAYFSNFMPYIIPGGMIVLEVVFILDMLGITSVLTSAFHPI